MKRSWGLDALKCPRCDGRMELIATIEDPLIAQRILTHLGLPTRGPPRPPAWSRQRSLSFDDAPRDLDYDPPAALD